jgi:hypothetical protein
MIIIGTQGLTNAAELPVVPRGSPLACEVHWIVSSPDIAQICISIERTWKWLVVDAFCQVRIQTQPIVPGFEISIVVELQVKNMMHIEREAVSLLRNSSQRRLSTFI